MRRDAHGRAGRLGGWPMRRSAYGRTGWLGGWRMRGGACGRAGWLGGWRMRGGAYGRGKRRRSLAGHIVVLHYGRAGCLRWGGRGRRAGCAWRGRRRGRQNWRCLARPPAVGHGRHALPRRRRRGAGLRQRGFCRGRQLRGKHLCCSRRGCTWRRSWQLRRRWVRGHLLCRRLGAHGTEGGRRPEGGACDGNQGGRRAEGGLRAWAVACGGWLRALPGAARVQQALQRQRRQHMRAAPARRPETRLCTYQALQTCSISVASWSWYWSWLWTWSQQILGQ